MENASDLDKHTKIKQVLLALTAYLFTVPVMFAVLKR